MLPGTSASGTWPGTIKPGQVHDALVSSIDFAPTLLNLAGLEIPEEMQGNSLASWCLERKGVEREAVYMELGGPPRQNGWRVVWDGRYVYSPVGFQILYDHKTDPLERYNLFGLLEHAQVEARLKKLLVSLAEQTEDPMLLRVRGAGGWVNADLASLDLLKVVFNRVLLTEKKGREHRYD